VYVANPRRLRAIYQNENKSDRVDAEYPARIGRLDPSLLFPLKHGSVETQADLALLEMNRERSSGGCQLPRPATSTCVCFWLAARNTSTAWDQSGALTSWREGSPPGTVRDRCSSCVDQPYRSRDDCAQLPGPRSRYRDCGVYDRPDPNMHLSPVIGSPEVRTEAWLWSTYWGTVLSMVLF